MLTDWFTTQTLNQTGFLSLATSEEVIQYLWWCQKLLEFIFVLASSDSLWDSENYETLQIWLATQSTLWHKVWVEIGDRWLKFSSVWQSFSLDAFGIPIWYLWTPNMQMEWSANPNGLLPLDLSASSSSFAAYKLWKLLQSWAFFIELKDITRPQCVLHILLWSIHSFALHFCYR